MLWVAREEKPDGEMGRNGDRKKQMGGWGDTETGKSRWGDGETRRWGDKIQKTENRRQ
jgi:hypothetical protein